MRGHTHTIDFDKPISSFDCRLCHGNVYKENKNDRKIP